MPKKKSDDKPVSFEQLLTENQELRRELDIQKASQRYTFKLFFETTRRMQISSASIKAAVSSLLSYDIFWDPANQHEFLQTINASTDKISKQIMLLSLALRAEGGSLNLTPEIQVLQEILAIVQKKASSRFPGLQINLDMPDHGQPVIVDYEYLIMALVYMLELVDIDPMIEKINMVASEKENCWNLDIIGLSTTTLHLLESMRFCKTDQAVGEGAPFSPEDILGLHIACEVLHLQGIDFDIRIDGEQGTNLLRIIIPVSSRI
jgi:hypothetical protein